MRRKLPILAVVVFAVAALAQSDLSPIPAKRTADSYAIYSMLMPGQPFSSMSPSQTTRWAIAESTVNISDMNPAVPPDGQLTPPPGAGGAQAFPAEDSQRCHHLASKGGRAAE